MEQGLMNFGSLPKACFKVTETFLSIAHFLFYFLFFFQFAFQRQFPLISNNWEGMERKLKVNEF